MTNSKHVQGEVSIWLRGRSALAAVLSCLAVALSNHRRKLFWAVATAVVCGWTASQTRADIFEWELSSGSVVQSPTVCPGGSGVNAVPSAPLSYLDLTQAYLLIPT